MARCPCLRRSAAARWRERGTADVVAAEHDAAARHTWGIIRAYRGLRHDCGPPHPRHPTPSHPQPHVTATPPLPHRHVTATSSPRHRHVTYVIATRNPTHVTEPPPPPSHIHPTSPPQPSHPSLPSPPHPLAPPARTHPHPTHTRRRARAREFGRDFAWEPRGGRWGTHRHTQGRGGALASLGSTQAALTMTRPLLCNSPSVFTRLPGPGKKRIHRFSAAFRPQIATTCVPDGVSDIIPGVERRIMGRAGYGQSTRVLGDHGVL